MKIIGFVILGLLLSSTVNMVFAQEVRNRIVETITIPFTATDAVFRSPEHYYFHSKHVANWILTIQNNLIYNEENPEAKVVLRLKENPSDTNFVEISMLSPPSHKLWVAVAKDEVGYMRLYEDDNAWFIDKPVMVSFVQNERLSVNNGQRIIVDRLRIGELTLGTIEVYGREDTDAGVSTLGGQVLIDVMSGNPLDNPILMIPPIAVAVTVGAVITLLVIKKRT